MVFGRWAGGGVNGLAPICPYCGGWSAKLNGHDIYPHRPDLRHKTFYACRPCDAYVGCHPGTDKPLGSLADRRLRRARNRAHEAIDPLWLNAEDRRTARKEVYRAVATALGIELEDCHIAMFDDDQCARVVAMVEAGEAAP